MNYAIVAASLLLATLCLVSAQVPGFGGCPEFDSQPDFDMNKFLGTWYEAERYVNIFEAGTRCVKTNYTKAVDGRFLVANEIMNRFTSIKRVLEGEIRLVVKGSESKMNVKYPNLPIPYESQLIVLDTDYDSYAVMWSCSGLGIINTQNAWIMTREKLAPGTVLQKAYGVLDKYKLSRTFFFKTDQSDCEIAQAENTSPVPQQAAPQAAAAPPKKAQKKGPSGHLPKKPTEQPETQYPEENVGKSAEVIDESTSLKGSTAQDSVRSESSGEVLSSGSLGSVVRTQEPASVKVAEPVREQIKESVRESTIDVRKSPSDAVRDFLTDKSKLESIANDSPKEPEKVEPVKSEPVKSEPVKSEPVKYEALKTESVKLEQLRPELPKVQEPAKLESEPVKDSVRPVEPVRAEPKESHAPAVSIAAAPVPAKESELRREPIRNEVEIKEPAIVSADNASPLVRLPAAV